jgi:predicted dehydrogenase
MKTTVNVALVGISGYGHSYLGALLDAPADDGFNLVGVVDPHPQRCRRLGELRERGIPLFHDIESLYADAPRVDLAMLATPIHHHAPQTCFALASGSSVLCEKPVGATPDDARQMLAAERSARGRNGGGAFVAIGFQWSFSRAIQALKRDVLAGDFGRPLRLKTLATMPRTVEYFRRNDWAGRIRTDDGRLVYDSPANNAAAHYLHNMLYLLGSERHASARPATVQAELYRANDIQNYDTAAMRVTTEGGAELLFYTSHSVPIGMGPVARYEFEHATVYYEAETRGGFVARFRDGSIRRYDDPNADRYLKIWHSIDAVRTAKPIPCGVRAASSHALAVAAAQLSAPHIRDFPKALVTHEHVGHSATAPMKCVTGLGSALVQCYDQAILPSEHGGLSWSAAGALIDLTAQRWSFDGEPETTDHGAAIPDLATAHPAAD